MRKILSIGLSLSMLAVCCFGALPAAAAIVIEEQTHTLHAFTAESADYWTLQQGMTKENADDGLTFNNAGDYGYTQNVDNFSARQYLTFDGARANVTDYSNIAQGIRLSVENHGPAVDTFVIIQVAMGPKFKSTVSIPAGDGVQKIDIPMASFEVNESSNENYPVGTTWEAFLESKPDLQDWFDIYLMAFNFPEDRNLRQGRG